jgi:hypothetical protein
MVRENPLTQLQAGGKKVIQTDSVKMITKSGFFH